MVLISAFTLSPWPMAPFSAYAQAIVLDSSSSNWVPVLVGPKFDPGQDKQAQSAIDLVGNAQNPLMYLWYDDKGDSNPANDELALRFRVDEARDNQNRFAGYLWIGIDVDQDGDLDVFLMLQGWSGSSGYFLDVYSAGAGLNNSPSTSSIVTPVRISDLVLNTDLHIGTVTAVDGAGANGNVDGDSKQDDFVSVKLNFKKFVDAANPKQLTGGGGALIQSINGGAGLTKDTPIRFVVASAQQANSLNGDMGGYGKDDNQAKTFTEQGAFTSTLPLGDPGGAVNASAITLTGPASVEAGAVSETFTLTVVNGSGSPIPVAQATSFTLQSNSTGSVTFSPSGTVTVPSGASSVTFTYSDTGASTTPKNVRATWLSGGTSLGSATHNITVYAPLALDPAAASVYVGSSKLFTRTGGMAPFAFTLQPNQSGGAVSATGLYTAGMTGGVTDTVVVTDAKGTTAQGTVSVQKRPTDTTVQCVPNPVAIHNATTCTATVTDISGEAAPVAVTGSVTFATDRSSDGGFAAGPTCTLNNGACSVSYTPTAAGTHSLSATYGGSGAHLPSAGTGAGAHALQVSAGITLAPGEVNVPIFGPQDFVASGGEEPYTYSIVGGSSAEGGTIDPASGEYTGGSQVGLTVTVQVVDSLGESAEATVTLVKRTTSAVLTCTPDPVLLGDAATCTATITDVSSGTAQPLDPALVTFDSGATGPLDEVSCTGTTTLACTVTYTPTVVGTHPLTLTYPGDGVHEATGGSTTVTAFVEPLTLTSQAGSLYVMSAVQLTASGGYGDYTYSIETNNSQGTVDEDGLYTAGPTGGMVDVVQVADENGSTATVGLHVLQRPTALRVNCQPGTLAPESDTTCTATVTDLSRAEPEVALTGSITWSSNAGDQGSFGTLACPLEDDGRCAVTYTAAATARGSHLITAAYAGDESFLPATGSMAISVQNGRLYGTVTTSFGTVVSGIDIVLLDENGQTVASTATGADGTYEFTDLLPGVYTIEVRSETASLVEVTVTMPAAGQVSRNIVIPNTAELLLTATPKQIVADGRSSSQLQAELWALDEEQTPLSGVTVTFDATAGSLSSSQAVTGDDGLAVTTLTAPLIEGVDEVVRAVSVTVHDVARGLFASATIQITFKPPTVTGLVMDNNSPRQPIKNAKVIVRKVFEDETVFEAITYTDESGRYAVTVPKGNIAYDVTIEVPVIIGGVTRTVTSTQAVTVGDTAGTGEQVPATKTINGLLLAPDGNQGGWTELNKVLPASLEVAGTLRTPDGTELPHPVVLHPDGSFQVDDIPIGTYEVLFQVVAPGGQRLVGTKVTITIEDDGELIVASALVDPFGVVTDAATGLPLEGVRMELRWADTGGLVDLPILDDFPPNANRVPQMTNEKGEYAWMVFPNRAYYIVATKPGYYTYDSRNYPNRDRQIGDSRIENGIFYVGETIVDYDFQMRKVPSASSGGTTVLPPLPTTGTVQGVVIDSVTGLPVPGARVTIPELNLETYTGADGSYQFTVPERDRTYLVTIQVPVGLNREITITQPITLPAGQSTAPVTYPRRTIAGQILFVERGGGEPAPLTAEQAERIRATVERADGRAVDAQVTIHPDGSYEVVGLPAGTYRVLFWTEGEDGRLLGAETISIPLTQDGLLALRVIVIDPNGTVRDARTGAPLQDVLVSLTWADTEANRLAGRIPGTLVDLPAAPAFVSNNSANPQRSDLRGQYGWLCLPAGDYQLTAKKDGYLPFVTQTATCNLDFTLEPVKLERLEEYHRYIKGYPDGTFRPEASVTRAEVAAIFARLIQPNLDGVRPATFPDLPADHWAARHIALVIEKGLMRGDAQGTFRPDSPITRAELATVIARFKHLPTSQRSLFQDTAGHWAEPAITAAFEAGIILGFPDNTFAPAKTTTRAELVAMVNRMLGWAQLRTGRSAPRWPDVDATHWAVLHIEKASISHTAKPGANQIDEMVEELKDSID